jgi:pyruvate dehydrogenase E1 component alpha subunit
MDKIGEHLIQEDTINEYQVMDKDGNLKRELPDEFDDNVLLSMLKKIIFYREFDKRAIKIQRRGKIGTYPPMRGQEGTQVGMSQSIKEQDWIVPTYREQILKMEKGVPPENIYLYWMGDERGHKKYKDNKVLPISVPIGSHIPHGAGLGMGIDKKDDKEVAWCVFGDGATSEGDFHEGMNFAGTYNIPTIFVCQNNQWAISVDREKQTASNSISSKATAYGFEGIQVDGMDTIASYEVAKYLRKKARGKTNHDMRPTLVEMINYRYGPHTTADDPKKYRDDEEIEEWKEKDPLRRLRIYLEERGILSEGDISKFETEASERVDEIVEKTNELEKPDPQDMVEHCYNTPPRHLKEQLREIRGDNNE